MLLSFLLHSGCHIEQNIAPPPPLSPSPPLLMIHGEPQTVLREPLEVGDHRRPSYRLLDDAARDGVVAPHHEAPDGDLAQPVLQWPTPQPPPSPSPLPLHGPLLRRILLLRLLLCLFLLLDVPCFLDLLRLDHRPILLPRLCSGASSGPRHPTPPSTESSPPLPSPSSSSSSAAAAAASMRLVPLPLPVSGDGGAVASLSSPSSLHEGEHNRGEQRGCGLNAE